MGNGEYDQSTVDDAFLDTSPGPEWDPTLGYTDSLRKIQSEKQKKQQDILDLYKQSIADNSSIDPSQAFAGGLLTFLPMIAGHLMNGNAGAAAGAELGQQAGAGYFKGIENDAAREGKVAEILAKQKEGELGKLDTLESQLTASASAKQAARDEFSYELPLKEASEIRIANARENAAMGQSGVPNPEEINAVNENLKKWGVVDPEKVTANVTNRKTLYQILDANRKSENIDIYGNSALPAEFHSKLGALQNTESLVKGTIDPILTKVESSLSALPNNAQVRWTDVKTKGLIPASDIQALEQAFGPFALSYASIIQGKRPSDADMAAIRDFLSGDVPLARGELRMRLNNVRNAMKEQIKTDFNSYAGVSRYKQDVEHNLTLFKDLLTSDNQNGNNPPKDDFETWARKQLELGK